MEALQVEYAQSFPRLLEERLQAALQCRVEVISAGVSGWGTDDEVTYLVRHGRAFHPDVVLFATTLHNDISDNLEGRHHIGEQGRLAPKPVPETPLATYVGLEVRSYLAAHSHLYQILYQSWKSLRRSSASHRLTNHVIELMRKAQGAEITRGWRITEQLFAKAVALGQEEGFQVGAVVIPLIYQTDDQQYAELLARHQLSAAEFDREKPITTLMDMLTRQGAWVVDLLPGFKSWTGGALYVEGDGHWNAEGHRLAASIAGSALSKHLADSPTSVRCR